MPGSLRLAAFVLGLVTADALADETFTCKDRGGRTLAGNGPPANECATEICRRNGNLRTCDSDVPVETPGPSPDPKDHEQFLSDSALLDRYKDFYQLEDDDKRNLAPVQLALEDAMTRLESAKRERDGPLKDQEEFYKGKLLPPNLVEAMASNEQSQALAAKAIDQYKEEIQAIATLFEERASRLRVLRKKEYREYCRARHTSEVCRG